MFFENYNFSAYVTDVIVFNEPKKVIVPTKGRPFYAISFRYTADTYFKTDNEIIEAQSNSVVLVPSDIDYVRVAKNEHMVVIHFIPTMDLGRKIKAFNPENYVEYEKIFERLLKAWERKDVAYQIKCNEYLMRLIHLICQHQTNESREDIAIVAARMIEKNVSDCSFCVGDIADNLNVSGTYLRRKFNEKYGISPLEYLIEKRMENAVNLLETNYFSVKEVAKRCGFENEKYFSTVFKKNYGISPSKY